MNKFQGPARLLCRTITTSAKASSSVVSGVGGMVPKTAKYQKVMDLQKVMCLDDGKLVWRKFGRDVLLYRTTMTLVLSGVVLSLFCFYRLIFPVKKE